MTNEINYRGWPIRVTVQDYEYWLCFNDVCAALNIDRRYYKWKIPSEHKKLFSISTPGGIHKCLCISLEGLIKLSVKKTEAVSFKQWIVIKYKKDEVI